MNFEANKKLVLSEKERLGLTADQIKNAIKLLNFAKTCNVEFALEKEDKLIIRPVQKKVDDDIMDELTGKKKANKEMENLFKNIFKR